MAHFDGHVVVPDEPLTLPVGQRVRINLEVVPSNLPGVDATQALTIAPGFSQGLQHRADGAIVVLGHRISLHLILESIAAGDSLERIHARYPTIEYDLLKSVLQFCRDNAPAARSYYLQQLELEDRWRQTARA